jgi:CO/xanthine dehydrogenase Mo-binding subunit
VRDGGVTTQFLGNVWGMDEAAAKAAGSAHLLEVPENEVETGNGEIIAPGTNRKMTFAELGRAVHSEMGKLPKDVREDLEATKLYDPFFGTASAAAHIAEVEIDPETYLVTVRRYVVEVNTLPASPERLFRLAQRR